MILYAECHNDGFQLFLNEREKPVGEIKRWRGRWFGQLSIFGQHAMMLYENSGAIVGEMQAWVAAGMPRDSVLFKPDRNTRRAAAYLEVYAKLDGDTKETG
jgi:hypothetical protein